MNKLMKCFRKSMTQAILLAAVLAVPGGTLFAQQVSDAQLHKRIFPVNKEATIEVENKYGTILVVPWQKDSVQISADIYLKAKNRSKLRKLKNDVRIDFSGTPNYVFAKTRIGEGSSRITLELRALSNTLSGNSAVEINYTVYVPDHINLFLSNKFGDIYIDDVSGETDISLSNGILKANSFKGQTKLELIFAEGRINEMATANVNLSYADLTVGTAKQLDIQSKSSEAHIDTIDVLKFDSRRDVFTVGHVEYLYGFSDFTDIEVFDFVREADCDLKYGKITVNHVFPEFSMINIRSEYAGVSLFMEREAGFNLDIVHNHRVSLNLPGDDQRFRTTDIGGELLNTSGTYGKGASAGKINIRADQKTFINIAIR